MLTAPRKIGYAVFWETGELTWDGKPRKADYYTKNHDEALKKQEEMRNKGFKNVTLTEAIF